MKMENTARAMTGEEIEKEEIEYRKELLKAYQTFPSCLDDRFIEIEFTGEEICLVCGESAYDCECDHYVEEPEFDETEKIRQIYQYLIAEKYFQKRNARQIRYYDKELKKRIKNESDRLGITEDELLKLIEKEG